MGILVSDLRHAFRMLRQHPGFTATAVLALALGIGANTAIFSVVNTVILKPLSFPDADCIVVLMNSSPQGNGPAASVPKYNVWRRQTQALEEVAAYDTGGPGLNVSGGDRPEQLKGIHVSREFFRLFGAQTTAGRTFTPEEDRPRGGQRRGVVERHLAAPLRIRSVRSRQGDNAGRRIIFDHRRSLAYLRF
jgi:putative ABC transport system permease protein